MTTHELASLTYFKAGERLLNGTPIDWDTINYQTMFYVELLRGRLDSPVQLIRGAHPHRPEAVDVCCPGRSLKQIFMELTRIPCSWGIYSGNSVHLDTRPYERVPARWLAVKSGEKGHLLGRGLMSLVTAEKDGWIYLSYGDPRSFEALTVVCDLAEKTQYKREEI